jgi:hypothetical protein
MFGFDGAREDGSGTSVLDDLNAAWDDAEGAGGDDQGGADGGRADTGGKGASDADAGAVDKNQNIDAGEKTGDKESGTGDDRPRDAAGRFAKKDDATDPKAAVDPAKAAAADPKAGEGQSEARRPEAADGPPQNWNIPADDWGKTPPAVRAKIAEREAQIAQGFQRINADLAPVVAQSRARNIPWQEGLARLTGAQERLDKNPHDALIWLAKGYGVNLDDLAEMAAGTMPVPGLTAPTNGNGQHTGQLPSQIESRLKALEGQVQEATVSPLLQEVQAFAKTADFFDELVPQINLLLPGIIKANPGQDRTTILRNAYSAAVAINPAIQAKLAEKTKAKVEQERRQAEEQRRGQRGSAAAAVHLQGQSGGAGRAAQTSVGSAADDLAAVWDEVAAR